MNRGHLRLRLRKCSNRTARAATWRVGSAPGRNPSIRQPLIVGAWTAPLSFRFRSGFTGSSFLRIPEHAHAIVAVFSADPEGNSEGSRNRIAPPDAARRHDTAGSGRHLRLAAARPAG